ncbi:MAG: ATP-binding protein, partial [Verrucomicrobiota bacterium]
MAITAMASLPDDPARRVAILEGIEHLLRAEISDRRERRIVRRIEAARFADKPTLESFDFAFQTGIDRATVMDMATLNWVDRREDLVLIGQSGVGKSHIAKALAMIGCGQERSVR